MKRKLLTGFLLFCLCFPAFLSGCIALTTYSLAIDHTTLEIEEYFDRIKIDTVTATVTFRHTTGVGSKIFCEEIKGQNHEIDVVDNTLTITQEKNEEWHNKALNYTKSFIVIYLDNLSYNSLIFNGENSDIDMQSGHSFNSVDITVKKGDIKWGADVSSDFTVSLSAGDIELKGATFDVVNINNSEGNVQLDDCKVYNYTTIGVATGAVNMTNVNLHNLNINVKNGKISFSNVLANSKVYIENDIGDVILNYSDAESIAVKTNVGNISAKFMTPKQITANAKNGETNVPTSTIGGMCTLNTENGNISVEFIPQTQS